jgi:hypothetical protein
MSRGRRNDNDEEGAEGAKVVRQLFDILWDWSLTLPKTSKKYGAVFTFKDIQAEKFKVEIEGYEGLYSATAQQLRLALSKMVECEYMGNVMGVKNGQPTLKFPEAYFANPNKPFKGMH